MSLEPASLRAAAAQAHHDFADRLAVLERRESPGPTDPRRYRGTARSLSQDLIRHIEAAEQVLIPAAVEAGGDAAAAAEDERPRLRRLESLLRNLAGLHDFAALDDTVTQIAAALRDHVDVAENRLIPTLEGAVTDEKEEQLVAELAAAAERAPTRPHPLTPDSAPWNKVAAKVTRRVDAVLDATDTR